MKFKMKIVFLMFLSVIAFTSCEDSLNLEQPGEVNSDISFSSVQLFQRNLNTLYSSFPYANTVNFVSVWTDEIKLGLTNGGQGINDGTYGYVMNDQSGFAENLFVSYESNLNLINRVIEGSVNVPVNNASDEAAVREVVAQARFLRALLTIQYLPYFTTDLSDDNALGLIVFEDVPTTSETRPRTTNGEIYSIVDQDLTFAEQNLVSTDAKFANVNACKAVRARMAIYRKQYLVAKNLAEDLIALYPLASRSQFKDIWTDAPSNVERIFYIQKQVNEATFSGIWSNVGPGLGRNNWYEFGRGLFEKYDTNDIRRYVYTGLPGAGADFVIAPGISQTSADPDNDPDYRVNDQICIYKYPGKNSVNYLNDYKIFRVSEMYLIKAEAEVGLTQLTDAGTTLKTLRDARYSTVQPTPNYASQADGYKDVLLERRRELCFEGHRYIDIKRLGAVANVTFDRYFRDCGLNNSCTPPSANDHRLTLPIPFQEINVNPTIVQNPNY